MAYVTSNPPLLQTQPIAGQRVWQYVSTDDAATVNTTGYITDGGALGMKVGDLVQVLDSDSSPPDITLMAVVSVSATYPGAVDLSDGTEVAAANAD